MKSFKTLFVLILLFSCNGKNHTNSEQLIDNTSLNSSHKPQDKIIFKDLKDTSQNFYTLTLPKDTIKGLLVLNSEKLSDSAKLKAWASGILISTIVPASNNLDNLIGDSILNKIDAIITEITAQYKIPKHKIVIGGMSAAGTGAIRYAEYCYSKKSKSTIRPIGVFAVDSPLDYERLWHEERKSIERNFSKDAIAEAKVLMEVLVKNLKGSPQTNIESYRTRSPFCYTADHGGNAYLLNSLAVRLYTEPDINWWIDKRRKDYYDLNAIDNAALINQLKLNGNLNKELITTSNKGFGQNGRHPHSWSIPDEAELLLWCNKLFSGA